jgi:site-specific DNA-methyltransferase (adenine-specific)
MPILRCVAGDARDSATYAESLGSDRADLLFTDPPYCLLTRRRKHGDLRDPRNRKIDHERVVRFETVRDYRTFTAAWLPLAVRHLAPEAPLVIWTNYLGKEPIAACARALGFALAGEFLWAKRTQAPPGGEAKPEEGLGRSEENLRVYEVALILLRHPLTPLQPGDPPRCWAGVSHYEEGEAASSGNHPHHKPYSILEPLIRAWSRPDQILLDPFAGSGSIPDAALKLGRRPVCSELDVEWARRVEERLKRGAGPGDPGG